jgi:hypothetical protein
MENFDGKNANAETWINLFEKECHRLDIEIDRQWEAIRLFLVGSATDWYQANVKTLYRLNWDRWRKSFLHVFASRGWSDVCNAYLYKFYAGSVSEYELTKNLVTWQTTYCNMIAK